MPKRIIHDLYMFLCPSISSFAYYNACLHDGPNTVSLLQFKITFCRSCLNRENDHALTTVRVAVFFFSRWGESSIL